jgi:DNA topoisomerase 2-associated protein PAT1
MRAATKPKPMTMEEIERDMMARQQQQFLQQQHYLQQQHLHHQQQQQQAYASPAPPHALQQQAFMSSPSLHQSQPNPSSSHQYPPQQPQQPYQNQIPPSNHAYSSPQPFSVQPRQNPNVPPPFPSSPAQAQAQAQRQSPPHQQQQQQPQQQRRPGPPQPTSSFSLADMFPALPGQEQSRAADPSTDVLGALAGLNEEERAMVKSDMERKIVEQEKADERRKRKAWKIAGMAQYNDIMTRSDKDFITRIQVSQLVTQDPYADDFYAQVYGAILRSKMGANGGPVGVLQLGRDGTGVGVGVPGGRGAGRRDFAMQRMTMQVKRIVDAAKQREGRKGDGAGLEGALGKISLRSYKTAPRPMLQTDSQNPASPAATKAEPVHKPTDPQQRFQGNPLTRRQTLIALESLYELVLQLEQLRRSQPPPPSQPASSGEGQGPAAGGSDEEKARYASWQAAYDAKVDEAWKGVMVDLPVEISFPHPFISLLTPTKGKRLLPRVLRHLSPSQTLTIFTLLLASFNQLDVVWNAPPPLPPYTKDEERREKETDVFLGAVVPAFLAVLDRCELRMVAGMVGLVAERCDVMALAKTRVSSFSRSYAPCSVCKYCPMANDVSYDPSA